MCVWLCLHGRVAMRVCTRCCVSCKLTLVPGIWARRGCQCLRVPAACAGYCGKCCNFAPDHTLRSGAALAVCPAAGICVSQALKGPCIFVAFFLPQWLHNGHLREQAAHVMVWLHRCMLVEGHDALFNHSLCCQFCYSAHRETILRTVLKCLYSKRHGLRIHDRNSDCL